VILIEKNEKLAKRWRGRGPISLTLQCKGLAIYHTSETAKIILLWPLWCESVHTLTRRLTLKIGKAFSTSLRRRSACSLSVAISGGQRNGVRHCAKVQKDDSADVAGVYRLNNLIMHGRDSSFCRIVGSVRRLSNREKLLWFDMTPETVRCCSLNNLRQKWKVRYRPVINRSISHFIVRRHDRMHTWTRKIQWNLGLSELETIAMPRISTQEKYSIETWLGLVGILVQHTR